MENWLVKIAEDGPSFYKNVWFFRRGANGKTIVLTFEGEIATETEYDERGALPIAPSMKLSPDMLQALADALSGAGIRPTEASKTEGLLEAQTAHLKDLRKLLKL
jgi:hypothetical protein